MKFSIAMTKEIAKMKMNRIIVVAGAAALAAAHICTAGEPAGGSGFSCNPFAGL